MIFFLYFPSSLISDQKCLFYKDLRSAQIEQKLLKIHHCLYQTTEEKAEIYLKSRKNMNEQEINHLRELYGLNPNVMPFALQFPRLPPGLFNPLHGIHNSPKEKFASSANKMSPQLKDFKEMYQKFASGLIEQHPSALIPPGHPLYSRQNSVEDFRYISAFSSVV